MSAGLLCSDLLAAASSLVQRTALAMPGWHRCGSAVRVCGCDRLCPACMHAQPVCQPSYVTVLSPPPSGWRHCRLRDAAVIVWCCSPTLPPPHTPDPGCRLPSSHCHSLLSHQQNSQSPATQAATQQQAARIHCSSTQRTAAASSPAAVTMRCQRSCCGSQMPARQCPCHPLTQSHLAPWTTGSLTSWLAPWAATRPPGGVRWCCPSGCRKAGMCWTTGCAPR